MMCVDSFDGKKIKAHGNCEKGFEMRNPNFGRISKQAFFNGEDCAMRRKIGMIFWMAGLRSMIKGIGR